MIALACFSLYATLSLRLHARMLTTGYDLGIFEQGISAYAQGRLPTSELKAHAFPLLGDHFSPILATLAPFYRLWPTPETLLLAQAALLAVAAVPLALWGWEVAARRGALVTGLGYGASWGIAQAVGFDFHEICFAVPLMSCAVTALGNERWHAAALWASPLVLVKEDLGLTVGAVGAYIAWRGSRRLGITVALCGLAGSLVAMFLVIPAFNPGGVFTYYASVSDGEDGDRLELLFRYTLGLVTPAIKMATLALLLAPTAFLALRSPLVLLAVPTLAWRFASSNAFHWGPQFHYSAVLMPVMFGAFVHGLEKYRAAGLPKPVARGLLICSLVTLCTVPFFPFSKLATGDLWGPSARVDTAHRILAEIPDGSTVVASNRLVPQLTKRCVVMVIGWPRNRPDPDWVVVDTATPQGWPTSGENEAAEIQKYRARRYEKVAEEDGYVLLRKPESVDGEIAG
ncbi:DUF2079 domain-containing protein [Streptomyces sp. NPDC008121]|uniref:DUF2079 domain-containing protein n=1 Tax=Streptomyces sp. NPDC008121 TaxID=3364809 RepID=UPI0036EBC80B